MMKTIAAAPMKFSQFRPRTWNSGATAIVITVSTKNVKCRMIIP
jgi:hypothetical protein